MKGASIQFKTTAEPDNLAVNSLGAAGISSAPNTPFMLNPFKYPNGAPAAFDMTTNTSPAAFGLTPLILAADWVLFCVLTEAL